MIAALFDADGTLHTAQFGRELMKYVSARGGRARVWKYYASVLPKYLRKPALFTFLIAVCLMQVAGCAPNTTPTDSPPADLTVEILYPLETTAIEMGQSFKSIVKVSDDKGKVIDDAEVASSLKDSEGRVIAEFPAIFGKGDVYRTGTGNIPHKMRAGVWTLEVKAKTASGTGSAAAKFQVNNSTSETLLYKYGFWINSPALRGIVPALVKEQGDAQNGVIRWGGIIPSQHIFPESWLEVQWRAGAFDLATADAAHEFISNTLGNPGVYPLRSMESFEQTKFKHWDAWKVKARGQFLRYDEQWIIFYAPEVNKTYALGTTLVLPPTGMDAHDALTKDFEVHPEIHADGSAPETLPRLLPPVELESPALGTPVYGTDQRITLTWKPAKELAEDEYYLVRVDYNYSESNPDVNYATRETRIVLPESLYRTPNCGVFNWQVTLMQKSGAAQDKPLSFHSLYWYILWRYPPGEEASFPPLCPNEQF